MCVVTLLFEVDQSVKLYVCMIFKSYTHNIYVYRISPIYIHLQHNYTLLCIFLQHKVLVKYIV